MLNFNIFLQYLEEAKGLEGSIGTEKKGLRHVKNYVMPYLSDSQRKETIKKFGNHFVSTKFKSGDGETHNPDEASTTHTLASPVNGHASGTHVKVTGARTDENGRIMIQTANHGEMLMSKLNKPEELKKPVITKGGFEVEAKIAKNLGTEAAGSTGTAFDYSYRGNEDGGVRGKARKIESDKPYLRGESKQNKAKMGESSVKFDTATKSWNFTNAKLAPHFSTTKVNGVPILEHLNKTFPDGNAKSFSTNAPKGTARNYLQNLGVNSLHLHRTEKATKTKPAIDHGTTFTIGDANELQGKTNLGHLSNEDLDKLDGKIRIEAGGSGSLKLSHTPNPTVFKEYASRSRVEQGHGDLTDETHANQFRKHVDNHIATRSGGVKPPTQQSFSAPESTITRPSISTRPASVRNPGNWTQNSPARVIRQSSHDPIEQSATASHGGMSFHSQNEQEHIRGSV